MGYLLFGELFLEFESWAWQADVLDHWDTSITHDIIVQSVYSCGC